VKERVADKYAELQFWVSEADSSQVVAVRLMAIPLPADLAPKRLAEWELSETIDSYVSERPDLSGAVLLSRGGNIVVAKAFGMADREMGTPATLDTRFRIGSMNKMFTAVAVLRLVEEGVIDLDAPMDTYLKQYPNANVGSKVTVRHLLTHTGGTGDIFGPEFARTATT
jgi:D-alanyl-D-alanine carboxypeptidase